MRVNDGPERVGVADDASEVFDVDCDMDVVLDVEVVKVRSVQRDRRVEGLFQCLCRTSQVRLLRSHTLHSHTPLPCMIFSV